MASIKLDSARRFLRMTPRQRIGIAIGVSLIAPFFLTWTRSNSSGMQVENRLRFKERPELLPQVGHKDYVDSLAFGANDSLLATGGVGDRVKIWDVRRGIILNELPGMFGEGSQPFSPDGALLALVASGYTKITELATGQLRKTLTMESAHHVAFSSRGQWLAVVGGLPKDLVRGTAEHPNDGTGIIKIFETATWTELATLTVPDLPDTINALCFSRDDQFIAAALGQVGEIIVWETSTWHKVQSLEAPAGTNTAITFSPDHKFMACLGGPLQTEKGKRIGSVSNEMTVRIWSVTTWHVRKTIVRHYQLSSGVAFSADGLSLIALVRGEARIWKRFWDDSSRRELMLILDAIPMDRTENPNFQDINVEVMSGALSSDGGLLAFASGNTVVLWSIARGHKIGLLTGSSPVAQDAIISTDNRFLAVVGDRRVTIWDLAVGSILHELVGQIDPAEIALSPDSRLIAVVGQYLLPVDTRVSYGTLIEMWDVESGRKLTPIKIPRTDLEYKKFKLCFSPDGQWLAVAQSNKVNVWEVATRRAIPDLDTHDDPREVYKLTFSADSKWLAAASSDEKGTEIKLWRAANWQAAVPLQLGRDFARALAFSPDNQLLAAARDRKITLWEIGTWKEARTLPCPYGIEDVFTSDIGKLVNLRSEGIELWNLQTGQEVVLDDSSNMFSFLRISSDGTLILATAMDGLTRFWDAKTGAKLFSLILLNSPGDWLVVSDDGLFDGTADGISQISWRFGSIRNIVPLDWYFNDFYYPGLMAELVAGKRPKACVDIATVLRLPGLHTMLEQNLARVEQQGDRIVVCFADRPTAVTFSDLDCEGTDRACVCRKEFAPGASQYEWLRTLVACKPEPIVTPWDNRRADSVTGTLHVLTVGIDKYDKSTSGLDPLKYSVSDAKAVRDFFSKQKKSASKPFENVKVWQGLYDGEATLDAIRSRMEAMAKEVKKTDVVFLFFSGHGKVPAGQEMFYFATVDMHGPDPEDERVSGLNTAMLAEALYHLPAQRIVLVIDACQSGGAVESLKKIGEVKAKVEMQKTIREKISLANATGPGVGVYILAAATPLQVATQNKRFASGEFVVALLEALKTAGLRGQKNIWMQDVVNYVNQRLPELLGDDRSNRKPMIVSVGLDFPIASRKN